MNQKNLKSKRKLAIGVGLTIVLILAFSFVIYLKEDFSISMSSSNGTVIQGNNIQTTIFVKHLRGINASIALKGNARSSGIQCSLNPAVQSPDFASNLTLNVPKSTPTGNYTVIVTATGGLTTHVASYTLSVLNADVNVSGTITTDSWVSPMHIQFIDQQTGSTYDVKTSNVRIDDAPDSEWRSSGSVTKGSYSVILQNQHIYNVSFYVSGIFRWEDDYKCGSLYVHAEVGSKSMSQNFSDSLSIGYDY